MRLLLHPFVVAGIGLGLGAATAAAAASPDAGDPRVQLSKRLELTGQPPAELVQGLSHYRGRNAVGPASVQIRDGATSALLGRFPVSQGRGRACQTVFELRAGNFAGDGSRVLTVLGYTGATGAFQCFSAVRIVGGRLQELFRYRPRPFRGATASDPTFTFRGSGLLQIREFLWAGNECHACPHRSRVVLYRYKPALQRFVYKRSRILPKPRASGE